MKSNLFENASERIKRITKAIEANSVFKRGTLEQIESTFTEKKLKEKLKTRFSTRKSVETLYCSGKKISNFKHRSLPCFNIYSIRVGGGWHLHCN